MDYPHQLADPVALLDNRYLSIYLVPGNEVCALVEVKVSACHSMVVPP
jgi:hypothetical protein